MTVDPTEPDTFEDVYEEEPEIGGFETPSEDSAEQKADLLRARTFPMADRSSDPEANPADADEQAREVELDEDEYR